MISLIALFMIFLIALFNKKFKSNRNHSKSDSRTDINIDDMPVTSTIGNILLILLLIVLMGIEVSPLLDFYVLSGFFDLFLHGGLPVDPGLSVLFLMVSIFNIVPIVLGGFSLQAVINRQMNRIRCGSSKYMNDLIQGRGNRLTCQTLGRLRSELDLIAVKCPNCGETVLTTPGANPKCPSCGSAFDPRTAERQNIEIVNN